MKIDNPTKFCRYFHGEEKPPDSFDSEKRMFWALERSFFYNKESIPPINETDKYQFWMDNMDSTSSTYQDIAPFIKNDDIPIETRIFITYATEDLGYMSPISRLWLENYFTPDERISSLEKERLRQLISKCKFYKGQKVCPYQANSEKYLFWNIEDMWVNHVIDNENLRDEYGGYLTVDIGIDADKKYGIDFYLLATLYDQYTHWGGNKEGFHEWLQGYINAK